MKLELHCTCGASWTMDVPQGSFIEHTMQSAWDEEHAGLPGHEPCDAQTAARARARIEREERKAAQ